MEIRECRGRFHPQRSPNLFTIVFPKSLNSVSEFKVEIKKKKYRWLSLLLEVLPYSLQASVHVFALWCIIWVVLMCNPFWKTWIWWTVTATLFDVTVAEHKYLLIFSYFFFTVIIVDNMAITEEWNFPIFLTLFICKWGWGIRKGDTWI